MLAWWQRDRWVWLGPLGLGFSASLLNGTPCCSGHGPRSWPWWRHAAFLGCRVGSSYPCYRLWAYTRWGAVHVDVAWKLSYPPDDGHGDAGEFGTSGP